MADAPQKLPIDGTDDSTRTRYSDDELVEFRDLINNKIESARNELKYLQESLLNDENGQDDNSAMYKALEEGSATLEKEHLSQMAARQRKFIDNLQQALVRIENKTYGICRETGKLIAKDRLRAVPHATLSMEAKLKQKA